MIPRCPCHVITGSTTFTPIFLLMRVSLFYSFKSESNGVEINKRVNTISNVRNLHEEVSIVCRLLFALSVVT